MPPKNTLWVRLPKPYNRQGPASTAMINDDSGEFTSRAAGGGRPAHPLAAALMPRVYEELRAIAAARLALERPGHTLQPTALVHEAFLKLAEQHRAQWNDELHFQAVAAEAIRRILVDHARTRKADKRTPPGDRVTISTSLDAAQDDGLDLVELDDALNRLSQLSPRQARIVELRFFAGLSVEQTARALELSEGTVKGDWRLARAWLQRELTTE